MMVIERGGIAALLFYFLLFNSNSMTQQAKRGRPAATKTTGSNTIKKVQGTPDPKRPSAQHVEYEMVKPNGALHMIRNASYSYYDESQDIVRQTRYCASEPSIFIDEQSDNPIKTPIMFNKGKLWVEKTKPNLKRFLDLHPRNEANGGNLFRRVDFVKKAEVSIDQELLVADAVLLIRTKPVDELLTVATAYGLDTDRDFAEIKHDLLVRAKNNPEGFIKSFDDPTVRMRAKVNKAVSYQILKITADSVRWFDTDSLILSVPMGMDGVDIMVRHLLTEKGAIVAEEIDKQLS